MKQGSSSRLEAIVNAVVRPAVSVALEHGNPSISLRIEREDRVTIIDTGSNISILQPGLSKSEIRQTDMRPYGVKGETLDVKGRQAVCFVLGGRKFNYQFLVCSLPTDADGLLGINFLKESGAIVDLECNRMSQTLGKCPERKARCSIQALHSRSLWRVKRDTALNPPERKRGIWTSRSQPTPLAKETLTQLQLG